MNDTPMVTSQPHARAPEEPLTIEALSMRSVADYRSAFRDAQGDHPWTRLSDEEFLLRLNATWRTFGQSQLLVTPAGLLMFGFEHEIVKLFPGYLLDYRRESKNGTISKRLVSNDGTWSGCLFDFWQRVSALMADSIDDDSARDPSCTLLAAAKEGLVNALVHADHGGRRHLVITQYADRVEYANPGDLRIGTSLAFEGGVSDPRNPSLMKMFSLIGACHDRGSGLSLIDRASERAGVYEPVLSQQKDPDRTMLTLFLKGSSSKIASKGVRKQTRTSSTEELVKEAGGASLSPTIPVDLPAPMKQMTTEERGPTAAPVQHTSLFETSIIQNASTKSADNTSDPFISMHSAATPRSQLGEDEEAIANAIERVRDPELKAVIGLFREKDRLKRSDVEALLGVGSTKAKAIVAELVSIGVIDQEGGGRSTLYRLAHHS